MNVKSAIRIVTAIALVTGLFTGPVITATADPGPPRTAAAKTETLIKKKCLKGFRADWRVLNHDVWAHAYDYYEGRRKAEQAMSDQMRWILADPEAHDLIPVFEQQAADDRAQYQPVVAKLRDDNFKDIKAFQSKYLHNGCLSKAGAAVFNDGIRDLRASFKDIYKAHEQLFRVNLAVQTAQMDLAAQCMQDADLEAATIEENWQRSSKHFLRLRHPS